MSLNKKTVIVCDPHSDVDAFAVGQGKSIVGDRPPVTVVSVEVHDQDSNGEVPLTTALLTPAAAVKLAASLLHYAGVEGRCVPVVRDGKVTGGAVEYTVVVS